MSDIEHELEDELHRVLDPMSAMPIPPRRSAKRSNRSQWLNCNCFEDIPTKLFLGLKFKMF